MTASSIGELKSREREGRYQKWGQLIFLMNNWIDTTCHISHEKGMGYIVGILPPLAA